MSGSAARRAAAAALALPALAGCSVDVGGGEARGVGCQGSGALNSPGLVLVAQAVPSAGLLPCIRSIPTGWQRDDLNVGNGRAEFSLTSDREGSRAFTVVLTRACDLPGASRVPSDQAGARRYELPTRITNGYAGSRFYVFPGGCVTYRYNLRGTIRAQGVTEISNAVGFTTRDDVAQMVRQHSDGRLRLDVPGGRS